MLDDDLGTNKGKKLVCKHHATKDAVCTELKEHCTQLTHADDELRVTKEHSLKLQINDGTIRGSNEAKILHWDAQTTIHDKKSKNDEFSDDTKISMLETFVSTEPKLVSIKSSAKTNKRIVWMMQIAAPGQLADAKLSHEQHLELLLNAAQQLDDSL